MVASMSGCGEPGDLQWRSPPDNRQTGDYPVIFGTSCPVQGFGATSCVARRRHQATHQRKCLGCQLLFWVGTNSQFDEPFFDIGADDIRMILLQVVNTRAKLHHSAVLKPLRKALSDGRRYQSASIACEK
jgi:hypothetical protein